MFYLGQSQRRKRPVSEIRIPHSLWGVSTDTSLARDIRIPFEKVPRGNPHCTFSVNFRCYPFFYADAAADITVTASGTIITNPGSVYSEPILTVTGSGNITLMVGMAIVELENISGSIVIDSVLQEAYQGTTLMNDHMNGEFPRLKPGANAISWTGTLTKVVIQPNWRFL